MSKIFVSSTIYDLIDLRAEVRELLSKHGYEPVMSEYPDFVKDHSWESAVEKCHKALLGCSTYLLIVGHRYGQIQDDIGISVTHQEFRWAKADGLGVIYFVRDTVAAEYEDWKNEGSPARNSFYMDVETGVLQFIEEIQTSAPGGTPLWRETFKDVLELKEKLSLKLGINSYAYNYIKEAQQLNCLPRLRFTVLSKTDTGFTAHIINVGNATALDVYFSFCDSSGQNAYRYTLGMFEASHGQQLSCLYNTKILAHAHLHYTNALGNKFHVKYSIDMNASQINEVYFGPPLG